MPSTSISCNLTDSHRHSELSSSNPNQKNQYDFMEKSTKLGLAQFPSPVINVLQDWIHSNHASMLSLLDEKLPSRGFLSLTGDVVSSAVSSYSENFVSTSELYTKMSDLFFSEEDHQRIARAMEDTIIEEIIATAEFSSPVLKEIHNDIDKQNGLLLPRESRYSFQYDDDTSNEEAKGDRRLHLKDVVSPRRLMELADSLDPRSGGLLKALVQRIQEFTPRYENYLRDSPKSLVSPYRLIELASLIDSKAGGVVQKFLNRSTSSNPTSIEVVDRTENPHVEVVDESIQRPEDSVLNQSYSCTLCNRDTSHYTADHICRNCKHKGSHRSANCPEINQNHQHDHENKNSSSSRVSDLIEQVSKATRLEENITCAFCGSSSSHETKDHICHLCKEVGTHRSVDCTEKYTNTSRLLELIEDSGRQTIGSVKTIVDSVQSLPSTAVSMVYDKFDLVLSSTASMAAKNNLVYSALTRIGFWRAGSQTPLVCSHAIEQMKSSEKFEDSLVDNTECSNTVVSFVDRGSIVPLQILKYMRMLMHHEVSANAFTVGVLYDSSLDAWNISLPGMRTPFSMPHTPRRMEFHESKMNKHTIGVLLGARNKLVLLCQQQMERQRQKVE